MRIVTWNCQMAFARKSSAFFATLPDIALIQECSAKDADAASGQGYSCLWFGSNSTKGIAVLYKPEWQIRPMAQPDHKWIVALEVKGTEAFTLIAVWSWVQVSNLQGYVSCVRNALSSHPEWFGHGPVVMAGDFNSNCRWDNLTEGGHTTLVAELAELGLVSGYHAYHREEQGAETNPTFHLYRHLDKPFHIDYIFVPNEWADRVSKCEVGRPQQWTSHSDHCPIIIDIAWPFRGD
jgi:exodeoxyribonuclease III